MTVPRTCISCHVERLGMPVTAKDCLGFVACETCTKLGPPIDQKEAARAWSEWLTELHERIEKLPPNCDSNSEAVRSDNEHHLPHGELYSPS
jgi:hypothetical protein